MASNPVILVVPLPNSLYHGAGSASEERLDAENASIVFVNAIAQHQRER